MQLFKQFVLFLSLAVLFFVCTTIGTAQKKDDILAKGKQLLQNYKPQLQNPPQPTQTPAEAWKKVDEDRLAKQKQPVQTEQTAQQVPLTAKQQQFQKQAEEAKHPQTADERRAAMDKAKKDFEAKGTVAEQLRKRGINAADQFTPEERTAKFNQYVKDDQAKRNLPEQGNFGIEQEKAKFEQYFQQHPDLKKTKQPNSVGVGNSISGYVYNDVNFSSTRDSGDVGMAGIGVHIYAYYNNLTFDTVTDSTGYYEFDNLPSYDYSVLSCDGIAGWYRTQSTAGWYYLYPNDSYQNLNFGNWQIIPRFISGTLYNDENHSGVRDLTEPPLSGWPVTLYEYSTGAYFYSTTDSSGFYHFDSLMQVSNYEIYYTSPNRWLVTQPSNGNYSFWLSTTSMSLMDFGNWYVPPYAIAGMKFNDLNGNGYRDEGEPGIPNWTINLYSYARGYTLSVTTDSLGQYMYVDSGNGSEYHIYEQNQAGWMTTYPSRSQNADYFETVVGDTIGNITFGNWFVPLSGVRGMKFNDVNNNGQKDELEPGIAGWKIYLVSAANTYDTLATVTDSNGYYEFNNLPFGYYYIFENQDLNWIKTYPSGSYYYVYVAGDTSYYNDFGNYLPPLIPLRVNTMPSFGVSTTYGNALVNQSLDVWGNVHGGRLPYHYILDYGDGIVDTGSTLSSHYIGNPHTYLNAGLKTMKLVITDQAGQSDSDQSAIRVYAAPTQQIRTNMAIEKGLLFLYLNQYPGGYWTDNQNYNAGTGASVLSFEENGHKPGNDINTDIYAEYVRAGLNYLFSQGTYYNIYPQSAGDPDVNGDGLGAYIDASTYANGIANLAIISSHNDSASAQQDTIHGTAFNGWTYFLYARNMVDQWAFSQTDPGSYGEGGWRYNVNTPNYGDQDNSTTQWAALDMEAAQNSWGIYAPQWVKDELLISLANSQDAGSGGFGYTGTEWLNVTKTAAAIGSYAFTGATTSTPGVTNGLSFLNNNWANAGYDGNGWAEQWNGNTYGMYAVAKGMRIINHRAGNQFIGSHDWYAEYVTHFLDDPNWNQRSDGSWPRSGNSPTGYMGEPLHSSLVILILTKGVVTQPPVAVIDPVSSRPPSTAFHVNGGNSYHTDPTKHIVQYLWDWDASNGIDWNTPDATGPNPLNPGYPTTGTYTITLRVLDDGTPTMTDQVSTTVLINDTSNHPPIAVVIPPGGATSYAGRVGEPIFLDGSHSYDPDAPRDSVVRYSWDTNGDGVFGDVTTDTTTVIFYTPYNGQVGLRVYDSHGDSSTNNAYISIAASRKDLFVVSLSLSPFHVHTGDSVHIVGSFKNDAGSDVAVNNVAVKFYVGDPRTTGNQMGGSYSVNLPIGGTATIDTKIPMPLTPDGFQQIYVFLDPNNLVDEWNEGNNIDSAQIFSGHWMTLKGTKFNDLNGNGVRDENEPGIYGWKIKLDGEQTHSTDSSGNYEYDFIPLGIHTISEVSDPLWAQTFPASSYYTVAVQSDSTVTGLDFGNHQKTGISGYKFNDLNGNGVRDTLEPGLANWTIILNLIGPPPLAGKAKRTIHDGVVSETTVTDANGNYSFVVQEAGEYTITEVQQSGWVSTTANPIQVEYTPGVDASGMNFGNFMIATISGMKFLDANGNGVKDENEIGLQGWTITATKGQTQKSTGTTSTGTYSFTFNPSDAGVWVISEIAQSGWTQTYPPDLTYSIIVQSGTTVTNADFGNFAGSSISGKKFEDVAGDSSTSNDPTMNGWIIKLYRDTTLVGTDTTSGSGDYQFTNMVPGTYTIREVQQPGWICTHPAGGAYTFVLTSGNDQTGKDFTNFKLGSISGTKFEDANGDSLKGQTEKGLKNWKIVLSKGQIAIDTVLTDSLGNYTFTNLAAGNYIITEILQTGWYQTMPFTGMYLVPVSSRSVVTGKDFGNYSYGRISGSKFFDRDSSGTKNSSAEGPVVGAKIVLVGVHTPADTVVTDTLGAFTFNHVPADNFTLSEVANPLWRQTYPGHAGTYHISMTSGFDTSGFVFGNFYLPDTGKFRTFLLSDYNKVAASHLRNGYIRKPSAGNVRDTVFLRHGFGLENPSDSGYLRIGIKRTDSSAFYGWFFHRWTKYHAPAVRYWIYNLKDWGTKRDPKTHLKVPRSPANYLGFTGEKVKETFFGNAGNALTMELTTLKTNIAASDLFITPHGFGDLVYVSTGSKPDTIFNRKSIRKIVAMADTALTNGKLIIAPHDTLFSKTRSYLNLLDSVISHINLEFRSSATTLDTISTKPLKLKGVKALYKVVYLVRDSIAPVPLAHFDNLGAEAYQEPLVYRLEQNYPNPFNPTTTIEFTLPEQASVTLKIFNILGQEVATVFNNTAMDQGPQAVDFDASNFATGVYFYRLEATSANDAGFKQTFTSVKKMLLIK